MHKTSCITPVVKKEFRQIVRDKRTLGVLLFIPAFMLIMFGYALTFDIRHIPLAVYDEDRNADSRDFINNFVNTEYFDLKFYIESTKEIDALMGDEQIRAAIVIPSGFANNIKTGNEAVVQIIVDGANSNSATTTIGYMGAFTQAYSQKILLQAFKKTGLKKTTIPIDFRPRIWFNPELKSAKFLIPGLIGFILMVTAVISTALSVVREKEKGTMEQLTVAPIKPYELIIGKMIPYIIISLVATIVILITGNILFDVVVRGSYALLFFVTLVFLTGCLGLGLLISTVAKTQQVAFMIATMATMLPTFILSGFVFPIRNMPLIIQGITWLVPARYYLVSLRCIILKGTGLSSFWDQMVYLTIFSVITVGISSFRMRKRKYY
ncbi:MAG: ABC transporter permease [candidate division Zixibacteria bacterium]|nr:ABC transporter permease [candidate division Zixibacteria bacterium]